MTEYDWDFEDEDLEEPEQQVTPGNLPKELRKVIRDAKKAEKAALEKAAEFEAQLRKNAVEGVLNARSVPAKVAKLIPADVEASAEAVGKWLDDYGDVFGVSSSAGQEENANTSAGQDPDVSAMQRMQDTASTGEALGGSVQQQLERLNDPNLTEEQLDAMIAAAKARRA